MIYTPWHLIQVIFLISFLGCLVIYILEKVVPEVREEIKKIKNEEIEQARKDVKIAEQDFDYAEPGYIDAAIYKLQSATIRYNTLLREQKEG